MPEQTRYQRILEMFQSRETIQTSELSVMFGLSEQTIRRDLRQLESDVLVKCIYGGAVAQNRIRMIPVHIEQQKHGSHKRNEIAVHAVAHVPDGSVVALDGGATTTEIAKLLLQRPLTVITNDLFIAYEVSKSTQVNLIVLSGVKNEGTSTLVGPECIASMQNYNVDIAFLETEGISGSYSLTTSSIQDAEVKKAMIRSAKKVYYVVDKEHVGKSTLISYAKATDVDGIITNAIPDAHKSHEITLSGANLHFV